MSLAVRRGVRKPRPSHLLLLLVLAWLAGCGWVTFDGDGRDEPGDGDRDSDPIECAGRVCLVQGGIRTLEGASLGSGTVRVHSQGFEYALPACGGRLCVTGRIVP